MKRVIVPAEVRRSEREAQRAEEETWAARSGPVTVSKVTNDCPAWCSLDGAAR